jgi:hypothetical protein
MKRSWIENVVKKVQVLVRRERMRKSSLKEAEYEELLLEHSGLYKRSNAPQDQ